MLAFFGVFGNPVSHSKSPLLHNYAFFTLGISGYYGKILLDSSDNLRKSFIAHNLKGANITIPFKEAAFAQCDSVDGIARSICACNTWVEKDNKIIGYNTDAEGFYQCLSGYNITSALILGAGGSAKAVALILKHHNIDTTIINRSFSRLEFFVDSGFTCFESSAFKPQKHYDIIINTTSAGLNDSNLPCDEALLRALFANATYAFDLIYGKQTPFLTMAKAHNLTCQNGKDMLINQAAIAFQLFCQNPNLQNPNVNVANIAKIMHEIL